MAEILTSAFIAALVLTTAIRAWLAYRQIVHVRAHRATVPAGFAGRIPLTAHQKAADYTTARVRFGMARVLVETLLVLLLTLGGGLAYLADFWAIHLDGLAQGLLLILSALAVSAVVDLPFAAWRQFVIEARFGFNRMTLALFVSDLLKSTLLGAAIAVPLILCVLWIMQATGTYWWLYAWLLWCGFSLLLQFVYPAWIAPLFNKFAPLAEGETRTRIEALLARCGFRSGGLFVMDGSRRSAHGNAYFTGFGNTKRIVFFDTLLERLQPEEIEAVFAHELGHFKSHHVIKHIVLSFALAMVFLAILGQLVNAPWFFAGLGAPSVPADSATAMALTLFFLVAPMFTFPLTPIRSLLSRLHEFEADRYAAAHARGEDLVKALVKLYEDNASTLTPDPLHSLFYDSHPPAAIRIARLQAAQG